MLTEDYKKMKKEYVCPHFSTIVLNGESVLNASQSYNDNDIVDGEYIWE